MKESVGVLKRINSMKLSFYKSTELNGLSHVKIPLRSSALMKFETDDKYCFIWSLLAIFHLCSNDHPNRVSNFGQYFGELNIQSFDFIKGFKCSDVHDFEILNTLSIIIYDLNFYKDGNKWKHKLIPIESS